MVSDIIYSDLSYRIVGTLYKSYNNLSGDYHEKYYQRAVAKYLEIERISYVKEFQVNLIVKNTKIGHHFVDFLIEEKIVLEIKRGNRANICEIKQVLMYLRSANCKLGILAYFGNNGVKVKRLINKHYKQRYSQ